MKIQARAALILALIIFAGCGTGFRKEPRSFYFPLSGEPNYLNYVPYTSSYEASVIGYLYQSMQQIDYNRGSKLLPGLATNVTLSADKRTYTCYMRRDVTWEDGKPVTAHDVVFTCRMILDPKSGAQNKIAGFKDLAGFKALNDYTFRITFKVPDVTAKYTVAGLTPIPRHIWQGKDMRDKTLNRKPVGNGPFRLQEWKTGRHIILAANPRYRQQPKFYFNRIVYKLIPESAAQQAALRKGLLDAVVNMRAHSWLRMKERYGKGNKFRFFNYSTTAYSQIAWQGNGSNPFFHDYRVRQAMTHALNRPEIIRTLRKGLAVPISGPFYPTSWAYDRSVQPLAFDQQRAAQLLDAAGWKLNSSGLRTDSNGRPFSFEMMLPQGSTTGREIAVILKNALTRLGIRMEIRTLEWSVFNKRLNERDFTACIFSWNSTVDPDVYDLWHSSMRKTGLNLVGYNNPRVDRLLEQAKQAFDRNRRQRISHQIHREIHRDQPYTFLYAAKQLDVFAGRIKGVEPSPRGPFDAWPGLAGWTTAAGE